MQADMVLNALASYSANKGRWAFLCSEIEALEEEMRIELAWRYEDAVLQPASIDGMPHGNQVSRTTENIAVRIADGVPTQAMRELQVKYLNLCVERREVERRVRQVDAWLQSLNDKQRWVIERQAIQGDSWRELSAAYRKRFGEFTSKDTLKRLKKRAVERIMEVYG